VALSEFLHIEPVLGAFMGGSVIAFAFRDKGMLESKISALGFGFLVPIFFIYVGHEFDLAGVMKWEQILLMLKLLGIAFLVKIAPAILFVFLGQSLKTSLRVGILLSTRLSLIVAAASLGVEQGLIEADMKDSIVLLAVVTCLLGLTLFKATGKERTTN
jgi:Kef-type K+ transport system membrane component KefB